MYAQTTPSVYDVKWQNLVGVSVSGNTVTKTSAAGWNAGASSSNVLPANTDGWVEFQYLPANLSVQFEIGLSSTDPNVNTASINFGIYFTSNNVFVYENGVSKLTTGVVAAPREVFRVERIAGKIYYKRSGTIIYTSTQTSTSSLIVDMSMYTVGSLYEITCSFGATSQQPKVMPVNNAYWQNITGASVSASNTLTKTTADGWTSGASTLNMLNPNTDGWTQFTVDNITQQKAFGLSRADADVNYTSIDYGFLLNGATASVSLAGATQASFSIATGDVLSVERIGTNVYFRQNGIVKYTVTNAYTASLIGDASLYTNGATLTNVQTSFWIPFTQGNVPDQLEFISLKAIYDSLGGSGWTTKTNWPVAGSWPSSATAAQMGTWFDIVSSSGDITQINLSSNKLSGKIPGAIGNLTSLTTLSVGYNNLTQYPSTLSNLKSLTILLLPSNNFSGTIPSSWSNLSKLTNLDLSTNHFSGTLPNEFATMTKLQTLKLFTNNFSGALPPVISNFTKLGVLELSASGFTGAIPSWIGNLTNLTTLSLNNNGFSGNIPAEIGNLTNLPFLDLSNNQFTWTNIPSSLYSMTSLTQLYLTNCPLGGPIPSQIGNLINLSVLNISSCSLTGSIPAELGNLTKLTGLYLQKNNLSGQIPDELSNLTKLVTLYMHMNQLSGPLPEYFGNFSSLSDLKLNDNQLTGGIPASYANLSNITAFQIQNNQLSGPIHDGLFTNWTKAVTINVSGNAFSGAFPSSIGSATKVAGIYANNNQLTSIPSSLSALPVVTYMNLSYNELKTIPDLSTQVNRANLTLYLNNNRLDFTSLKPLKTAGIRSLTISPQNTINDVTIVNVPLGSSLIIQARPKTSTTTIVWERQAGPTTWTSVTSLNEDATAATFKITSPTSATAGVYHYKMTDLAVFASGGTITSDPITVNITDAVNNAGTYQGTPLYNGNITAQSWRTEAAYATGNSDYTGMYLYKYDNKYQVQESQFAYPDFTTGIFALAGNNFREFGYTYDPNGNIKTLKRYDGNGNKIHDLSYSYTANKNQLQAVTNNGSAFRNYQYNAIGQMTTQDNSTGTDQVVDYDVTGKVTDVYQDAAKTKKTTHYTYDDRGFRLSKETYDDSGTWQFTTWYICDASGNVMSIYEQQANDTNLTLTETPIYGSGKLGLYRPKSNGGGEYVYELTDHLGNVRATLKNDQTVYLATMEDNGHADYTNPRVSELQYFTNLFETQKRDTRMNHTASTTTVPAANTSYLNWTSSDVTKKAIGAGITLKVESGDQLNLEAYAKYQNAATYTRDATTAMLASLLSASFIGTNGLESTVTAAQDFTNGLPGILAGTSTDPNTRPYAYLNYMVFDKNFVFMDGGAKRVPAAAGFDAGMEIAVQPQKVVFDSPITINQTGFIYVWVSNESANTQVWWDDLKVTHTGSRVTQATDYYAFGSVMREQSIATEPTYKFGYQGQFAEKDDETGWNHFELREFDPIIGRWTVTDPAGQYWSPYIGMGNNPVDGTDPDGAYSRFGAWLRSGFGLRGSIYQSGVTEDGSREVWGFNTSDGVAHFGDDAGRFWKSLNFSQTDELIRLADNQTRVPTNVFETGDAIEPCYPETWFMPVPKGLNGLGFAGKASKSLFSNVAKEVPSYAKTIAQVVAKTGRTLKGYKGGRNFENDGRNKGQILPKLDPNNKPITYREFDVHPFTKGINRGMERVVIGSDGSSYFTSDHYITFTKF
jgi:RHS repeat-associated protein